MRALLAGVAILLLLDGCGQDCHGDFDPCCDEPDGTFCAEKRACDQLGERWHGIFDPETGFTRTTCEPLDAGIPDLIDATPLRD